MSFNAKWFGLAGFGAVVAALSLSVVSAQSPQTRKVDDATLLKPADGEWVGYSYAWNDEQTDAVLVDKDGQDREFTVRSSTEVRKQKWHYPSPQMSRKQALF